MKTIGLLGGMSWESSALYYKIINQIVRARLGSHHSAPLLMYSYDFEEIKALQFAGEWDQLGAMLGSDAARLERGGAECILLCTNTMHMVVDEVTRSIDVPVLHIAECTADRLIAAGVSRVALIGTIFTMEGDFYSRGLEDRGLQVLVPREDGRREINRVIYEELCSGAVLESSRVTYVREIEELAGRGAEAVILGCTEIGMLVGPQDSPIPAFDTTRIHAEAAVEFALT